ncbi:MAG: hypothetical protein U5K79_12640 [Cyclobacteriaceae bacterium]|nr:hypothetical protein [Cyclobacteriaceae bacterium]
MAPKLDVTYIMDPDFDKTDQEIEFEYGFEMLNRSQFGFGVSQNYIRLLEPFDPTNSDGVQLPAGSDYSHGGAPDSNTCPLPKLSLLIMPVGVMAGILTAICFNLRVEQDTGFNLMGA